jgi:WAS/WASL-interacting protein
MAGSSVKLPVVDPFELPDPKSSMAIADAPELEAALMTQLQELVALDKPSAPAPRAAPPPSAPGGEDRTAFVPDKPKLVAEYPPPPPAAPAREPEPPSARLTRLRPPAPRLAAPVRDPRLAALRAKNQANAAHPSQSRWDPPTAPPEAAPAQVKPPAGYAPPRPRLAPPRPVAVAAVAQVPPPPPPAKEMGARSDQQLNEAAERALRGWSAGDELARIPPASRPRRPPRIGLVAASLLLVGAGGGAILAVQWGSRDAGAPAVATVASTELPRSVQTVTVAGSGGTTSSQPRPAGLVPAAQAATLPPAAGAVPPPPVAAPPAPVQTAAVSPSAPVTAAPTPAPAARAAAPAPTTHLPAWYVEDDEAHFETATAAPGAPRAVASLPAGGGKRMVVTADVDIRTGADAGSASLGVLKTGAVIAVGDCNQWCAVTIDGKTGWVFSAFLADPATAIPR